MTMDGYSRGQQDGRAVYRRIFRSELQQAVWQMSGGKFGWALLERGAKEPLAKGRADSLAEADRAVSEAARQAHWGTWFPRADRWWTFVPRMEVANVNGFTIQVRYSGRRAVAWDVKDPLGVELRTGRIEGGVPRERGLWDKARSEAEAALSEITGLALPARDMGNDEG